WNLPSTSEAIPPELHPNNSPNSLSNVEQQVAENLWFVMPAALFVLGTLALIFLFIDTLYLRRLAPTNLIHILYRRIVRFAGLLGLAITPSQTPHQMRVRVDEYFVTGAGSRSAQLWHGIDAVTDLIVAQYGQTTYGAYPLTPKESALVIQKWQAVRLRLVLLFVLNVFEEQAKRF